MGTCYFFSPIGYFLFFFCRFIWKGRVPVPVISAQSFMNAPSSPIKSEIHFDYYRALNEIQQCFQLSYELSNLGV